MMVAGTAAAVGLTLVNERKLQPAFVEAAPLPRLPIRDTSPGGDVGAGTRSSFVRLVGVAAALAVSVMALATALPAMATTLQSTTAPRAPHGPALNERAAATLGSSWEQSFSHALPSPHEVGSAVIAGAQEWKTNWEVLHAMNQIEEKRQSAMRATAAPGRVTSLNATSGIGPGTILRARITIYGCTGPGGGFCGGMASGIKVFEGAAACSNNLPFGTKVRIIGDPTGRVYECLDRGALPATWVDVFFYNTTEGMAWQGTLGGTVADIEIVN